MKPTDKAKADWEKAKKCVDQTGQCNGTCRTCEYYDRRSLVEIEYRIFHLSLSKQTRDEWRILPREVAENPYVYHYGETWLAYDHEPREATPKRTVGVVAPYKPTNSELLAAIEAENNRQTASVDEPKEAQG